MLPLSGIETLFRVGFQYWKLFLGLLVPSGEVLEGISEQITIVSLQILPAVCPIAKNILTAVVVVTFFEWWYGTLM